MRKPGKSVQKVAAYIRRTVKRPKGKKPYFLSWTDGPRFKGDKCPMGLLPEALDSTPADLRSFSTRPDEFTSRDVRIFGTWWDRHTKETVDEAMDFVWPKKK